MSLFSFTSWQDRYDEEDFDNFVFDDLDLSLFDGKAPKWKFHFRRVMAFKPYISLVTDILTVISYTTSPNSDIQNVGWVYLVCFILGIFSHIYDHKKAIPIIKSADVSDAFISEPAYRYWSAKSYSHFCFLTEIANNAGHWDARGLKIHIALESWFSTFVVDTPQGFMAFIVFLISSVGGLNGTGFAWFMSNIKFFLVIYEMQRGMMAVFFGKNAKKRVGGDLGKFVSYRYDKIVNELIASTEGVIINPEILEQKKALKNKSIEESNTSMPRDDSQPSGENSSYTPPSVSSQPSSSAQPVQIPSLGGFSGRQSKKFGQLNKRLAEMQDPKGDFAMMHQETLNNLHKKLGR